MPAAEFELRVTFRNVLSTGEESPFTLVPIGRTAEAIANPALAKKYGIPLVKLDRPRYPKNAAAKEARTTIEIDPTNASHVELRFWIVDADGKRKLQPTGIDLSRADETVPIGTPITTGNAPIMWEPADPVTGQVNGSPFTGLKLNEPPGSLQYTVERMKVKSKDKGSHKRSHTTYRFRVYIQDLDTGEPAVIDPETENPY